MRFAVLGPLAASGDGGPIALGGPKQRLVLAHLLLQANTTVPIEHLIDAVWGEEPPETARATLQAYVSRLRAVLGSERIEGEAPGYRFHVDPAELDRVRFESLLRDATEDGLSPSEALGALDEALELWRGPALADLAEEASLLGEISRLEELRLVAVEERIGARLDLGQHAEVVAELERLTAAHPMRERHRQLILPGHDLVASGLSFSPDGTRLASNAPDGVARVWALDIDDLIDIAKTKVTRDLTDEECRQYLHVARCPTE